MPENDPPVPSKQIMYKSSGLSCISSNTFHGNMPLSKQQLDFILSGIYQIQTTPAEFIVSLLRSEEHTDYNAVADIARRADEILESLRENEQARAKTLDWASKMTTKTYAEQIRALVQKNAGLQFSAHDTTSERLATFNIQELAVRMQNLAPALWDLLDSLLAADQSLNARRNARQEERAAKATPRKGRAQADGDIAMREPDEAHSDAHDEVHEQGAEDAAERRKGLVTIVSMFVRRYSSWNKTHVDFPIEKGRLLERHGAEL